MQFDPITEKCIRNPFEIRKLKEPERSEMLKFLKQFRLMWRKMREYNGD